MDNDTARRTIRKCAECRAEAIACTRHAELCEAWGGPSLTILANEYRQQAERWLDLADGYLADVPAVLLS